jgi:SAM-dependent methyltransferase
MLERAAQRTAQGPVAPVQADLLDLPFRPGSFETVGCFGVLHVLDDLERALVALREQIAPGGQLFASMLVSDRGGISRPYMEALSRRGELGPTCDAERLAQTARAVFDRSAQVTRTGSMAWLRVSG